MWRWMQALDSVPYIERQVLKNLHKKVQFLAYWFMPVFLSLTTVEIHLNLSISSKVTLLCG